MTEKLSFASDNLSPAHPLVLNALCEANLGHAIPYGGDLWTLQAEEIIQRAFRKKCKILFVPSGTAANVLGLKIACKRHESILCSDIAHIDCQESGAAESVIGCKLLRVPSKGGKIYPEEIFTQLQRERGFGRHGTSPRILSITQPTEIGTVYTVKELKELATFAKEENLLLHMDGSRLYNALVTLDSNFSDLLEAIPLDILSLGGTKNGLLFGEAVLLFNPSLEEGSPLIQKQTLQLLSKMRYLSAQYIPLFRDDLWWQLAYEANQKGSEIASIIKKTPQLSLTAPVETNQVFFSAPREWIPLIQEKIFCYLWNKEKNQIRFIASWNTSDREIKGLEAALKTVSESLISL